MKCWRPVGADLNLSLMNGHGRAILPDSERDPGRVRLSRSFLHHHALAPDVHGRVAERLVAEGLTPVLDVECGEGELARHLPVGAWVGVDTSPAMLARAPEPKHLAKAAVLPFADASFGAVALLHVLYHLLPALALAEAHRVLHQGGLVVVAAPSRDDSPELAEALPRTPPTLDSERAPERLGELFTEVEVERWDAPPLELATRAEVRDYLIGKGVEPHVAEGQAEAVAVPLSVTRRGAFASGRKA